MGRQAQQSESGDKFNAMQARRSSGRAVGKSILGLAISRRVQRGRAKATATARWEVCTLGRAPPKLKSYDSSVRVSVRARAIAIAARTRASCVRTQALSTSEKAGTRPLVATPILS